MTEDLHDLTKFLLDRLKTYPEEFVHPNGEPVIHGKWFGVLDRAQQFAAPQDKEALNKAFTASIMDKTFQQAMKVLLAPEEESANIPVGQSSNSAWPHNNPGGQFGVSGGSGGPGLTKQQAQAAIAQQQAAYQQQDVDAQVRALGFPLKPIPPLGTSTTVLGTTYEQIKKRLGL